MSRFIRYLPFFIGLGLLPVLHACVDQYDPGLTANTNLLVVEGIVTDQSSVQTISLSRSRSSRDSLTKIPIQRAAVTVLVNGSTPVRLSEVEPGIYQFPAGFKGQVGQSYQLRFRTEQGVAYESSVETMVPVPPVLRAYDTFNEQGIRTTADSRPVPTNDVYVDFQDPGAQTNFYLWRWRLYESQRWCATCEQGRYTLTDLGPVGSGPINVLGCVRDTTLGIFNLFDYPCRGLCWDIFYSTDVNVFADLNADGRLQVGRKVASIPIYQRDQALLVIEQLSLSPNAYRYYKLFADQTQNTGTLADTPPAPTVGNVRNLADPNENVVGYFSAASVAVLPYKLTRQNVTTGSYQGLFYAINRRLPNVESPRNGGSSAGVGVPSAICIPSRTRTDLLPPGW
ncbi:DUF4249 domain-containing protein [Spirosoma rigui]|uniref:DUF4249 domain-containing protein n=1 Tax=Spirosoma rigui TaxID=564064 RepID=UPI0009B0E297|nr:DUF4249 domain-containing protein [Spirosoma rigui]